MAEKMKSEINVLKMNCTKQLKKDIAKLQAKFPKVAGAFGDKLSLQKKDDFYMQALDEVLKKDSWETWNIVDLAKKTAEAKIADKEFYAKAVDVCINAGSFSNALKVAGCAAQVGVKFDMTESVSSAITKTASSEQLLKIVEFAAASGMNDPEIYEKAFSRCINLKCPNFGDVQKISECATGVGVTLTITKDMCKNALEKLKGHYSSANSEIFEVLEWVAKAKMKDTGIWNEGLDQIIKNAEYGIKDKESGYHDSWTYQDIQHYMETVTKVTELAAQAGLAEVWFYQKAFDKYCDKKIMENAISAGVKNSGFIINVMNGLSSLSSTVEVVKFVANAGIKDLEVYNAAFEIFKRGNCRGHFYLEGAFEVAKCAIAVGIEDDEFFSKVTEKIISSGAHSWSEYKRDDKTIVVKTVDDISSDILSKLISLLADKASRRV